MNKARVEVLEAMKMKRVKNKNFEKYTMRGNNF